MRSTEPTGPPDDAGGTPASPPTPSMAQAIIRSAPARRTRVMSPRPIALAAVVAAAALLAACGDDDDTTQESAPPSSSPDAGRVEIERSRFAPEEVTVGPGATVTFVNLDAFAHTVTSADGSGFGFDSDELGEGDDFRQRFDDAGTYDYFCEIHPTMRASVVVR